MIEIVNAGRKSSKIASAARTAVLGQWEEITDKERGPGDIPVAVDLFALGRSCLR